MFRNVRIIILAAFVLGQNMVLAEVQRSIHFAGVDWYVKSGGPMGPGPNYWSDSESSVWIDNENRLHLTIRYVNGRWYCSEIFTHDYSMYGEHRFFVDGYIDRMDKNIVLGLFTYANDNAEIDIEYAKWGYANNEEMASFTIQPGSREGNSHSFASPLTDTKTTHFFNWQAGYVLFGSMHGHHLGAPPSTDDYIEQWVYSGPDIPSASENLRLHLNFWLFNGSAPVDQTILEVIITDIKHQLSTGLDQLNINTASQFELRHNFPNPFNASTLIHYKVQKECFVELEVYSLLGKKISTLVARNHSKGNYSVPFNAAELPSGIYVYKINAGPFSKTRKMILIR